MTQPWDDPNRDILADIIRHKRMYRDSYKVAPVVLMGRGFGPLTPIFCFRIKDLEVWTQDYAGNREHVATSPNEDKHAWLINCLVSYHGRNVYQWDTPDSAVH